MVMRISEVQVATATKNDVVFKENAHKSETKQGKRVGGFSRFM